jgi:putative ABC transport system permease protein
MLSDFVIRLRALFRRNTVESELDDELRFHFDQHVEKFVQSDLPLAEARRRARLMFGGSDQIKEECHDVRGRFLETLAQDVRFGARMLRKSPGFTTVAILTLALGIGANTAIFSLVNGILLRPLPYVNSGRLVQVTGSYPRGALAAMREQLHTVDVAAYAEGHNLNLTGVGEPVRLHGTLVSAELFSILGEHAQLGRTFLAGEDLAGQDSFVILSYALWQLRFGGDPAVVGHWISLDGVNRQILGVMPADFRFPAADTDVWIPLGIDSRNQQSYWASDYMPVIGRLRPGANFAQASAEARAFQSQLRSMFPWQMPASWNADVSVISLQEGLVGSVRARLLILLSAVVLVLLIACANVANLTLSRAAAREKEIAIRLSLGAGRERIIRQLITESVVLASVGAAFGLVFAAAGIKMLKSALPAGTPRLAEAVIDWRVLCFTAGLAVLTGVVFGVVPAFQAAHTELTESLKSGGRGMAASVSYRFRTVLVTCELALAVVLASGAGLLIRSLWTLSHVNPGFHPEHMITARIAPNESFCSEPGRCLTFYRDLVDRLRAMPGVSDAGLISTLPLGGRVDKRAVNVEDFVPPSGEVEPLFWLNAISPVYFHALGIILLRGREFTAADTLGNSRVAIVSASTAKRYWKGQDAVGRHIRLLGQTEWCTIVGVVADVRAYSLERDVPEWIDGTVYLPYGPGATLENGRMPAEMTLVLRTAGDESLAGEMIREAVSSLNKDTPVSELRTMPAVVSDSVTAPRSVTSLFASFAGLAFILGAVGIYGVISFFVGQRTREIGIRMALGALRTDVLKMVMREGLLLAFMGVGSGLLAAFVLTRFLSSFLYGVGAADPLAFGCVSALFAVVALAACYIPARRAMRVDPMVALRYE